MACGSEGNEESHGPFASQATFFHRHWGTGTPTLTRGCPHRGGAGVRLGQEGRDC